MTKKILSDKVLSFSITRQFHIETKGGTKPDQLSQETKEKIFKNIKILEKFQTPQTPAVKRMMEIFLKSYSKNNK